jgi:hypothetical protein
MPASTPLLSIGAGQIKAVPTLPLVTHAAGMVTIPPNGAAMCQSSTGTTSVQFGACGLNDTVEVSDVDNLCSGANITVTPPAGGQLEDVNAPGVYQAANASSVFNVNGQFARWRCDGANRFKLVGVGT